MADRRDGLARADEIADQLDRRLIGSQPVGAGDAARDNQGVVVGRLGVGRRLVDREQLALDVVLHGVDLAGLGRHEVDSRALVHDRLPRHGQLRLLDAVRGQECDPLALELVAHVLTSFGSVGPTDGALRAARAGGTRRREPVTGSLQAALPDSCVDGR